MSPARLKPRTIQGRVATLTFVLLALLLGLVAVCVDRVSAAGARAELDRNLAAEASALAARTRYHGDRVELEAEGEREHSPRTWWEREVEAEREGMGEREEGEGREHEGREHESREREIHERRREREDAAAAPLSSGAVAATAGSAPLRPLCYQVSWSNGLVERSPENGPSLPVPAAALLEPLPTVRDRRVQLATVETKEGCLRVYSLAVSRAHYTSEEEEDERPDEAVRTTVVVQVARSPREAEQTVEEVRVALALSLPLALVLGTLGTFLVAKRALAPIGRLGRDAGEIAGGALEKRLDLEEVEGELRELAQTLNAAFERLAGAVARERRFSSDVAHELRTPISIARSTLELALLRDREPEAYREALRQTLDANSRLEAIVTSLLLLGRAESVCLVKKPHDLRAIVASAADSLAPTARKAGVEVKLTLPETPVPVLGHSTLLERLAANLIDNALRHGASPWGVEVLLGTGEGQARIAVMDRGPGFPDDFAERAFERFARADDSRARKTGGAGLGLSIAKAIARAHGGELHARKRVGGGAELLLALPLDPGAPAAPAPAPSVREPAARG